LVKAGTPGMAFCRFMRSRPWRHCLCSWRRTGCGRSSARRGRSRLGRPVWSWSGTKYGRAWPSVFDKRRSESAVAMQSRERRFGRRWCFPN
jgi:hypothetical protein